MHHVILIIVMRLLHSQSHILSCLDCIQRHYCSRVKTVNLFVWHFIVLYLLPEGSSSESLCPGCDGSLVMFWAFLRHLALYSSSREGREQPVIFLAVFMTLWSAFLSAAVQLTYHTHTCGMSTHSLLSSNGMTQAFFLRQVVLSEESQKVKSLLCRFDGHWGVRTPRRVFLDLDAQEPEVRDSSPRGPRWCTVVGCFLFSSSGSLKDQFIFPAPPSQLLHFIPTGGLIPLRNESHYCGVACTFNSGVAGVGRGVVMSVEGVE